MDIVRVEDPGDWRYPFSQSLYEDYLVVYHGTSSAYASVIEREGFIVGRPSIPIDAIRRLIAACDTVGFKSWSYTTVQGLSRGTILSSDVDRPVYFSANFWFARDYATNSGGETVHNALLLSDQLLEFLSTTRADTGDLADDVRALCIKLRTLTADSFPVVYAVRLEREWLKNGETLRRLEVGSLVVTHANVSCLRSVPAERLLAKAEYVNGADPGYLGPQPATWAEARHLGRGE